MEEGKAATEQLAVDGDNGCAKPHDDKDDREDEGRLVVRFQAEKDGKRHTDEQRAPQVPVTQLCTHRTLGKMMNKVSEPVEGGKWKAQVGEQ